MESYNTSIGSFRLCCIEEDSERTKQDQTLIDYGIDSHWNSTYMRQSRLNFLANQAQPSCRQCWNDDENGRTSLRQRRNKKYLGADDKDLEPWIEHFASITDELGHVDISPKGLMISVGNTCQLRCTHCSPAYSNNVAKEYVKLNWHDQYNARRFVFNDKYLGAHRQKDFDSVLWDQYKTISQDINWISASGGEPTISKGFFEYLKWLVTNDLSKQIDLHVTTNALSVSDAWIDVVARFRSVEIRVSIDGSEKVEHYIRFPTRWKQKIANIKRLAAQQFNVKLFTTIYALNICDYEKLLASTKDLRLTRDLQILAYPEHLDIRHLPQPVKNSAIKKLVFSLQNHIIAEDFALDKEIRAVIGRLQMPADDLSWARTKKIIAEYDRIRPYSLKSVIPDLDPYLD